MDALMKSISRARKIQTELRRLTPCRMGREELYARERRLDGCGWPRETCVRKTQLRTKFLLALLAITAGLTAATLLIVSYGVRRQVRAGIREDLQNSVNTYQIFEKQRD